MPEEPSQQTIVILTDATADVPAVERDVAGASVPWVVVPEHWRIGVGEQEEEFLDDGTAEGVVQQRVLADQAALEPVEPGWEAFVAAYSKLRSVDRVFSIHSPSRASWAVEHAREAAGGFPNVRVIEANVTGIGLGLLARRAQQLAAAGAGPDAVERWLRVHRDKVRMLVVPDRFDPNAGQRTFTRRLLGGQAMLQAGAAGRMDTSRRLRSRRATVAAIERYFSAHVQPEGELLLALGHADAAGAVDPFLDVLERIRPDAHIQLVGRVGPRLVQQLGTRCVAAAWLQETDVDSM